MSAENKSIGTRAVELSQKFDVFTSGVAVTGSAIGLIPIGFTMALLGFNLITYFGAEAFKEKK